MQHKQRWRLLPVGLFTWRWPDDTPVNLTRLTRGPATLLPRAIDAADDKQSNRDNPPWASPPVFANHNSPRLILFYFVFLSKAVVSSGYSLRAEKSNDVDDDDANVV